MALGAALKRAGCNFDEMRDLLLLHPSTSEWTTDKGDADNARELKRIWEKVEVATASSELQEPSIAVLHQDNAAHSQAPNGCVRTILGRMDVTCCCRSQRCD